MNASRTIACSLPPSRRGYGQRRRQRPLNVQTRPTAAVGRVPRISRLMALALRLDELVRTGMVADYAELACLGHVSRARISQILNLLALAPDLQEALLFLAPVERGRDPIHLGQLQPLTAILDWQQQRCLWHTLKGLPSSSGPTDGSGELSETLLGGNGRHPEP